MQQPKYDPETKTMKTREVKKSKSQNDLIYLRLRNDSQVVKDLEALALADGKKWESLNARSRVLKGYVVDILEQYIAVQLSRPANPADLGSDTQTAEEEAGAEAVEAAIAEDLRIEDAEEEAAARVVEAEDVEAARIAEGVAKLSGRKSGKRKAKK